MYGLIHRLVSVDADNSPEKWLYEFIKGEQELTLLLHKHIMLWH